MPAQHINLDHPALHRQRVRGSLAQGLAAALVLSLGVGAMSWSLHQQAARARRQSQDLLAVAGMRPLALDAAASAPAAAGPLDQELAQLRALDAVQRRVQQALQSGVAGAREGYTGYFQALARQTQPTLWITGLAVGADGQTLEVTGRMLDAQALPAYLRRLGAEPRFRGRSFAQLQLKSADEGGLPVTEFTLRSAPGAPAVVASR